MELQPVGSDARFDEVVDNGLGTSFGEVDVIVFGADAVGVGGHLDCYVWVVAEHLDELVERFFGFGPKCGFVEVIEYVFDNVGF